MNRLSAAALAATALLLSSGAQASSLLATADLSTSSGFGGAEPDTFDFIVDLQTWDSPLPFETPTGIISLFQVSDLENTTAGTTLTLTSGATFDAAVTFLTNGIGYTAGQYERLVWSAGAGNNISYEDAAFGLDTFDFAGDTIESIELVLNTINIDRDYEVVANPAPGTSYRSEVSASLNIYGTSASAAVPIPAAGWLMLSGLGFLAARRRRS